MQRLYFRRAPAVGCFYLSKRRQMQRVFNRTIDVVSCFYLSKRRQMQLDLTQNAQMMRCFYLSKRRQMQRYGNVVAINPVVFTFQKEGRCNEISIIGTFTTLFLPFKKKADATNKPGLRCGDRCFYLSKRRQMQP